MALHHPSVRSLNIHLQARARAARTKTCSARTFFTFYISCIPLHWHHNSALQNCGPRNETEINVCEILKVNMAPFASKASYCSKGVPQKYKYEYCSNVGRDRCIWLLRFSAIFSASLFLLTLMHAGAIPPLVVKTRGFNKDFSINTQEMRRVLWLNITPWSIRA